MAWHGFLCNFLLLTFLLSGFFYQTNPLTICLRRMLLSVFFYHTNPLTICLRRMLLSGFFYQTNPLTICFAVCFYTLSFCYSGDKITAFHRNGCAHFAHFCSWRPKFFGFRTLKHKNSSRQPHRLPWRTCGLRWLSAEKEFWCFCYVWLCVLPDFHVGNKS
mgnify:CR=1 FL=1